MDQLGQASTDWMVQIYQCFAVTLIDHFIDGSSVQQVLPLYQLLHCEPSLDFHARPKQEEWLVLLFHGKELLPALPPQAYCPLFRQSITRQSREGFLNALLQLRLLAHFSLLFVRSNVNQGLLQSKLGFMQSHPAR